MKKELLYLGVALFIGCTAIAQNKEAIKFSQVINKDQAYKHLSILASDAYEGRETATKGGWMAAEYIKDHFKKLGLYGPVQGDYFQPLDMVTSHLSAILTINGKPAEPLKDFYIMPQGVPDKGYMFHAPKVLFAGYGLSETNYNDYAGVSVTDKLVMIFRAGGPGTGNSEASNQTASAALNEKIKFLRTHHALAVLVIDPAADRMPERLKSYLQKEQLVMKGNQKTKDIQTAEMPVVTIGTASANAILEVIGTNTEELKKKIADTNKPATQEIEIPVSISAVKIEKKVRAENVLGFMEGSDPALKKEVLVITAHYDHIGITPNSPGSDKINNGADDDGSGTTGVLLIAKAFSDAKRAGRGPKRSILFMTVTGEEKGLLGSEWYSEHPVFPLENTIADLNIDMIGRGDKDHAGDNNFIYIIGSDMLSSDLDRIGKKANRDYVHLNLDEKYNNRTDPNRFYYRSDHYNFAKHGIPVIFYFNGVHEDYHQPGDEVSKIDFPMLAKRAKLVYFTAWELANASKRPKVDKNEDGSPKLN